MTTATIERVILNTFGEYSNLAEYEYNNEDLIVGDFDYNPHDEIKGYAFEIKIVNADKFGVDYLLRTCGYGKGCFWTAFQERRALLL